MTPLSMLFGPFRRAGKKFPSRAEVLQVLKEDPMIFYWMDRRIWHDSVTAPPWVNAKDTVIGMIRLDPEKGQALLETNSRERFKKCEKTLRTLGDVELLERVDAPVDVEAMMNQGKKGGVPQFGSHAHPNAPPEDIWNSPEEMESFFAERWLKEKIPALGNRTPMGSFDVDKMKARLGIDE